MKDFPIRSAVMQQYQVSVGNFLVNWKQCSDIGCIGEPCRKLSHISAMTEADSCFSRTKEKKIKLKNDISFRFTKSKNPVSFVFKKT